MPDGTGLDRRRAIPRPGFTILVTVALVIGSVIAAIDSRPGWDDAGVTAGLLVIGAAVVAGIDGGRPWLWAALVGGPLPIVEVPSSGSAAPLVALLFAAIGASLGVLVRSRVGPART